MRFMSIFATEFVLCSQPSPGVHPLLSRLSYGRETGKVELDLLCQGQDRLWYNGAIVSLGTGCQPYPTSFVICKGMRTMQRGNRKSAPRVIKGRVQKKNNWSLSVDYYRAPQPR